MENKTRFLPLVGLGFLLASFTTPASGQSAANQSMPGRLSAAHAAKPGELDCAACHVAPGKIAPTKCLACHTEIGARIASGRGYHRDKADDCAVCHAEHQGRQHDLIPVDPSEFDHTETGANLQGAHLNVKACDMCHTPARTLPRSFGRSYLFKVPGCRGCHPPPHPGRQENCLACHGQSRWDVGRPPGED